MSVKIITTSPTFASLPHSIKRLTKLNFELVRVDTNSPSYFKELENADFLVAGLPSVDKNTLNKAKNLKAILKHGVGLDGIDVVEATRLGRWVTNTPGANALAVAEICLATIFVLRRNLLQSHLSMLSQNWLRKRGHNINGQTLGIIGFGHIGKKLASLGRSVGMQVLVHTRNPSLSLEEEFNVACVDKNTILRQSDVISLHLPATSEVYHYIDAQALTEMKSNAILLNFARGSLVDYDALAVSLSQSEIAGAAIDTYPSEPPDWSHPIFECENVIFSPHIGADTDGSISTMSEMVIDDIVRIHKGERPLWPVNNP